MVWYSYVRAVFGFLFKELADTTSPLIPRAAVCDGP